MKKLILPLLFLSISASAQFNIEKLLSAPFPNELKASTDGAFIAWVFNHKGVRNIWIADKAGQHAKQITHFTEDDGLEITDLDFMPDNSAVLFVHGNDANSKGEFANPARLQTSTDEKIYLAYVNIDSLQSIGKGHSPSISPDGKQIAFISSSQLWIADKDSAQPKKLFQLRGNQSQIRWSPDGNSLAFISRRSQHALLGIYNFITKNVSFPDASTNYDSDPVWSSDGKYLAYIRKFNIGSEMPFTDKRTSPLPWSIRLLTTDNWQAKEIWQADEGAGSYYIDNLPAVENHLWFTNDNHLIFPWEKRGWMHLYALDIQSKKVKLLTPGDGEVEKVVLSPDKKTIVYCTNIGDISRRHIYKISSLGSPEMMSGGEGIEYSPAVLQDGVAILRSTAQHPLWPAIITNNKAINDIATAAFPNDYPTSSLVTPSVISFTATDGEPVPAQLFLPKNMKPGEKHPAIVFFHGGSRRQMLPAFHYMYYYYNAYALNQYFVSKGYIVLSVNYRSGIGYGLNFREALNYGANGASEVNDAIGAGLYLKTRSDVDGKHISAWGGSYGGFLTAFCLAKASNIFSSGVDMHGVHNWNTELGVWRSYDSIKAGSFSQKAYRSSPIAYIDEWRSPVLLIQGDDDRNVNFNETITLASELGKRKIPFKELVFPDEVHDFLLFSTWVKAYNATFDFIDEQNR